jgi:hypothetical protein
VEFGRPIELGVEECCESHCSDHISVIFHSKSMECFGCFFFEMRSFHDGLFVSYHYFSFCLDGGLGRWVSGVLLREFLCGSHNKRDDLLLYTELLTIRIRRIDGPGLFLLTS